jgi:hypothetical protein
LIVPNFVVVLPLRDWFCRLLLANHLEESVGQAQSEHVERLERLKKGKDPITQTETLQETPK